MPPVAALLAGFYQDPDPARRREFVTCLERNVANEHIGEVHLFLEEGGSAGQVADAHAVLRHPKVRLLPHGRRTTFNEMFDHANRALPGRRAIIANADIYFDHTLGRLEGADLSGKLACLSRWDVLDDGSLAFFDHPASQDAWIFDTPVPPIACNFHLGLLGCDNRLAWEAQAAGLAVFNPGRSVRACHLHRSFVRRYTERQRLAGPVLAVASATLATPWLSFVVPCRGDLGALGTTLDSLDGQRRSSAYVVDCTSPEGAGAWTRAHHPEATVVPLAGRARYHAAEARNRGAEAADDTILCFIDPGLEVPPGFSERVLGEMPADGFIAVRESGSPGEGAIACRRSDFLRAGGYDEALLDPGEDHADLAHRLRVLGLAQHDLRQELRSSARGAPDWVLGDARTSAEIQAAYRRVKAAMLAEAGGRPPTPATLRRIYRDVARHRLRERALSPALPDAQVAFSEKMGYAVARLEPGVSSHVNLANPWQAIPAAIAGKAFTQVVAYSASPVEIEFLGAGKVYVLVATDWYGYTPAVEWLTSTGFREPLPAATTAQGTAFEVWSVLGVAGETFVTPTQVMLVASDIRRRA